jgi:hypothetical protein
MKKLLLSAATASLLLWSGAANADVLFGTFTLEYSEAFGFGNFGSVTITGTQADALVRVNVGQSWLIDTGGPHQPFAFNLNSGTVFDVQLDTLFAASGSNGASPFGTFTNTIVSLPPPLGCSPGGSNNGCGVHELTFHVSNYTGFFDNPWDSKIDGIKEIYYAADIRLAGCTGDNCTGNVGGGTVSVPGPIVGAGVPGLVAACGGLFGFNFFRRRRNNGGLPA